MLLWWCGWLESFGAILCCGMDDGEWGDTEEEEDEEL